MYTLKSIARRGTTLGAAFALVVSAIAPAVPSAFADALNPLTDRSLTLSSSSPGWSFTDGSGNSTYAPPNSGANGKQTGNTFSFKVSTNSTAGGTNEPIKTISFQYCTTSAGACLAPGNDDYDTSGGAGNYTREGDSVADEKSDLNVVATTPSQIEQASLASYVDTASTAGDVTAVPAPSSTGTNFIVMWKNGATWESSDGWDMSAHNVETGTVGAGTATGKNNYIVLANPTGLGIPAGAQVKVVFFGTNNNYITNPGSGAFFVKINTYKIQYDGGTTYDVDDLAPAGLATDIIDGGVTVANVMNQSIQITTKVLETMQFSVGTVDPNVLESDNTTGSDFYGATGKLKHGPCDLIVQAQTSADPNKNVLQLGDQAAESALSTEHTYATHSYWRLSSNSSAGATVYYSGHTLSNTVGDEIDAIGDTKEASNVGSEQFGLAIANVAVTGADTGGSWDDSSYGVDYSQDRQGGTQDYENADDNGLSAIDNTVLTDLGAVNTPPWDYTGLNGSYHTPRLDPLLPATNYSDGAGKINSDGLGTGNAQFAFDPTSDALPVAIASESSDVVDCVTAKMRYIANIAATTPAGIYTTKVNYIAAPQY